MRLAVKIISTALAAAMAATGCSDHTWLMPVGLAGALANVKATETTRRYVEYGDIARISALADQDKRRFAGLRGVGFGSVGNYAVQIEEAIGLDLTGLGYAVQVGNPPDGSGVAWGSYDTDALNGRLDGLDIDKSERDGATYWRAADDREIDFRGPFADLVPTSEFNNLRVAEGSFAWSSTTAGVDLVVDPEPSLAGDEALRPGIDCLGDVVAAIITTPEGSSVMYSIGVRADTEGHITEVLCLAGDDPARLRDRVARELAEGTMASEQRRWSEVLPGAQVETVDSQVRITASPPADAPAGIGFRLLLTRDLDGLTVTD